ncbi:MAG TPA: dihydrofolate reductase family protein [Pseudoxanthomonas sp.]
MGKVIVEQIISADGYAAETDGGIGFFASAGDFSDAEPEQLRMMAGVGGIVFGRVTYGMFADYWPQADPGIERVATPINALPKFVVSSTLQAAPWGEGGEVEILRGDGVAAVRALRARIDGDLILWGSLTLADALLRADEVDVLRLRLVPVLIGRGRSFTPADLGQRKLSLVKVDSFASGHAVLEYAFAATA